jgi:hypothetical protein
VSCAGGSLGEWFVPGACAWEGLREAAAAAAAEVHEYTLGKQSEVAAAVAAQELAAGIAARP